MEDEYTYPTGEEPKFYIFKYKKATYVLIDLEGESNKSTLERIINAFVGERFNQARERNEIYNPYRAIDEAIRFIERQYGMIVLKDPTELKLNQKLREAINKYNASVSNNL